MMSLRIRPHCSAQEQVLLQELRTKLLVYSLALGEFQTFKMQLQHQTDVVLYTFFQNLFEILH